MKTNRKSQREPVWVKLINRESSPLSCSLILSGEAPRYNKEIFGFPVGLTNCRYINRDVNYDLNELEKLQKAVTAKLDKFLTEFPTKCYGQCDRLLAISEGISKIRNLNTLPLSELDKWWQLYIEQVLRLMPFVDVISIIEKLLEEQILSELKERLEKNKIELFDLVRPTKDNYAVRESRELIAIGKYLQERSFLKKFFEDNSADEIAQKLASVDQTLFQRLVNHIDEFGFLDMYFYIGAPPTIEKLVSRLKELLKEDCNQKIIDMQLRKEGERHKYLESLEKLNVSNKTLRAIEQAQEFIHLRLHRLDLIFRAGYLARNFLVEIARRAGLSYNELVHFAHYEIMDFLEGKRELSKKVAAERQKDFGALMMNSEIEIVSGERLAQLAREKEVEKINELQGRIASRGRYRGLAKIVRRERDLPKVEDGDIIVSPMTNPYFMPAMLKAGAIVTDEGGVLCHAAIVSRELQVPCVVGTKTATKHIKDGDLIDVDASGAKGVVKIVSRYAEV